MEASGTYVPWETDYSVSGNPEDGYLSVDYSFYASDGTPCTGSTLTVCLLDEDGMVIGVGTEFIEKIGENEKYDGTVKVYGDKDILSLTKVLRCLPIHILWNKIIFTTHQKKSKPNR